MKKVLAIILAALMIVPVLLSHPLEASAESLYIRKIVSVVYDDSGSMRGEKTAFANYAMQTFCGMLNSEDQLYITYMRDSEKSGYQPQQVDLSAGGIQGSVDTIRSHATQGGTPYTAVETAWNKLKSVQDSNPNTQYWLVVITDGAFDECSGMNNEGKKRFLNQNFNDYTNTTMSNGTKPQVTFMGIGNVVAPDENPQQGIYTYSADNAQGIIGAMSNMADRISGRTRLQTGDAKKIDDNTIQVSSSIPLLNIAVLSQGANAQITKAVYSNEKAIPISRKVSLSYPDYPDLTGGAFLIGDSQSVIGSGTYNITFDKKIDLSDVVILFEPALEMRMTISLNGKEISSLSELDSAMENDKISASCKVYEMGTDTEISPSLLPPGTKFSISISENGQVIRQSTDTNMLLTDYVLKNVDTELTAAVMIDGFNPISNTVKFTPTQYVPKVVYSLVPSFGSSVKSVKFDDIGSNQDLSICFTVMADGVPVTDVNAVKAMNPTISVSPAGNAGAISYSSDGKIVFTPNAASAASGVDSFQVEVTCSLADGITAKESYTVLIATYEIFAQNGTNPVVKTQLHGNQESVSFYITKDGVRLGKAAVENLFTVELNEVHSKLKNLVVISEDGLITVTPYDENELKFNWFTHWADYFWNLPVDDIQVTLSHSFGTASAAIDVVDEDVWYIFLNVILPLVLEAALLMFLLWWAYTIWKKPRFPANASIYMANLSYDDSTGGQAHEIGKVTEVPLQQYNGIQYYLWPPTMKAPQHYLGKDLTVSAAGDGNIYVHSELWYKGPIVPENGSPDDYDHPRYVKRYTQDNTLRINTISLYNANGTRQQGMTAIRPLAATYYVHTTRAKVETIDGVEVIQSGTIFAYATNQNN